jgi:hypothetical protein
MRRFVILTSLVLLAAASANCSSSPERNVLGPSAVSGSEAASASGKGGGKPSGGGGTSGGSGGLTLVMYADNNGNGLPNWNDTVTFNVSTTATTVPYVDLACSQNNAVVASASAGFFDSYPWPSSRLMTLSSRTWTGGAADCTANLGYYNTKGVFVVVASIAFHVNA